MRSPGRRRVLFRVDSSVALGAGHVVRCLAVSEELTQRAMAPVFASRRMATDAVDQIEAAGYPVVQMTGPITGELAEIGEQVPKSNAGRPFAAVVMDHYGLGAEWLTAARSLASRRIVIDDLANRPLPCEVIVNMNLGVGPRDYEGLAAPGTRLLLGQHFALLRPAFRASRAESRSPVGAVKNVLVSMGGSDPLNVTSRVVSAVRSALPTVQIEVVLGSLFQGESMAGPGIRVHRAIDSDAMARLMIDADLAIGAGGVTAWERCVLGLPSVILRLAPNQDGVATALGAFGAAVDGGPADVLDSDALSRLVRRVAEDRSQRQTLSDRGRDLVDGRGVERVAHHIDAVRVRRATMADTRLLLRWANDPETRAGSLNEDEIAYPDHVRWLENRLADPSCLLLIGMNGAGPLGQVRFDVRDSAAEVSISVAPEHRGTVGTLLLEAAIHRFRRWLPDVGLLAQVKLDNDRSRKLFERVGFSLVGDREGVLLYHASALPDAKS